MEASTKDRIAERWGIAPDDAINYATIPAVAARSRALAGRTVSGMPWVSPYPPAQPAMPGPFSLILDAIHPPERPINRLLSLCCGHGHSERALAHARTLRSFDGFDISAAALAQAEALARAAGLEGINYALHDINQLQLTGMYDFVYAGGLHHIKNLEHVCAEIRAHLEPGAPFMMYEYVGSARCQYTDRQVEGINACIRLLPERLRVRVTAQRELGVASSQEAYDLLQRQRAPVLHARPVDEPIPLSGVCEVGAAAVEAHPDHVRVTTPSGQWHYGATLPVAPQVARLEPGKRVVLVVDAELRQGDIGIGCVAADGSTFLCEMAISSRTRRTWRLVVDRTERWNSIVVRNSSASGAPSTIDLYGISLAVEDPMALKRSDDGPLAADPNFGRHFWTEFTPMTVEQWIATDPSESVRADEIIPVLRATFPWVDVRYTRCSLLQFVLYDLASNFYGDSEEVRHYLDLLFHVEDVVMAHDDVPENFAYIVAGDRDLTRR